MTERSAKQESVVKSTVESAVVIDVGNIEKDVAVKESGVFTVTRTSARQENVVENVVTVNDSVVIVYGTSVESVANVEETVVIMTETND